MLVGDRTKLIFVSMTLIAALAMIPATGAVGEETAAQPASDSKAANSASHSPETLPSGAPASPASNGANSENIDMRITVQPHGPPAGKPGKFGGATTPIVPLKSINPHRRTFSPSRAANRFQPNASGIPGVQRQSVPQTLGEHFEYKSLGPNPAIGGGGPSLGLIKPGSVSGRQIIVPPTGISPLSGSAKNLTRGVIGGPGLNRHTVQSSTAGIGGPARTVTGINGTSIRASH